MEFFKNFFKKLLPWNHWSDFEIILRDCSLGDPFQKLFTKFWSVEKHGPHGREGGDFLHYMDMKKFLKKSSSLKPLVWFCNNFTGIFLGWPFSKIVCEILIHRKTWLPLGGDFLHYMDMKKFLKNLLLRNCWSVFGIISEDCSLCDPFRKLFSNIWSVEKYGHGGRLFSLCGLQRNSSKFFSSETACQILKLFIRIVPWVTLFKNCLRNFDLSVNMALANGSYLHCTNI